mmetsp:Transcript_4763/g.9711  ORF Transcript_4763/g.9711 Transcript_4763/m.9711 type:complete len:290 (-) Transcript_4763:332-1201(-)|eukprot:CAMPEP_0118958798 /NCGR_PEP_ID=MMETSP1169-20130426/62807_1 /TAXON_ID=36882 /ORGANISM="Pyramimonas obovata, Strain CCMP722" /LENGTH=289 /DNA_ID=CAMNT_0006906925 /DNA_START=803 /DNA_END=1672 /DNA_ORIENTATION=-
MGDNGAKAAEQVKAAEKKLASWSLFSNKYEDAAELLEKAANNYKLAKLWDEAGSTYMKLAECHVKCDSKHDAASTYVDAANSFKKTSTMKAVECLEMAIEAFTELGRLSLVAKHHKDIGEILEAENNIEKSMYHFEQAAEMYEGEEQTSTANTCKLKVAQFSAKLELYVKAIELFEAVALASLDNNLLKYSVKTHLLHAGLCQLCRNDTVAVHNALEKYQDMDPTFSGTRESKFLQDLAQSMEEGDVQQFTNAVAEYDSLSRLDSFKTTILLSAKKIVASREGGAEDLT